LCLLRLICVKLNYFKFDFDFDFITEINENNLNKLNKWNKWNNLAVFFLVIFCLKKIIKKRGAVRQIIKINEITENL